MMALIIGNAMRQQVERLDLDPCEREAIASPVSLLLQSMPAPHYKVREISQT